MDNFLKNESKMFSKFKEIKAMVEKQSRKYIIVLTSDGGLEYESKKFA